MLAACGTNRTISATAEGQVFQAPPHAIKGATPVDQRWIDKTVAIGVGVFDWHVPERPPELDRPKAAALPKPAASKTPPKKPTLRDRLGRAFRKGI